MSTTTSNNPLPRRIKVTTNLQHEQVKTVEQLNQLRANALAGSAQEKPLETLEKAFQATGNSMKIIPKAPSIIPEPEFDTKERVPKKDFSKLPKTVAEPAKPILPPEPPAASFQPRIKTEIDTEKFGYHAVREGIPSNGVFYDFDDITIRPFNVPDFAKIYRGNVEKRDDLIIDTVNSTTNIDVWDLTEKDFRYVMYWQRLNSFTRNPYNLTWTTFYGNQNTLTINKTNLKVNQLDATREEYQEWKNKGFCMPTMRDLQEYLSLQNTLSIEDQFLWIRAKYLSGNSVAEKLQHAVEVNPDEFFIDVKEFVNKFENYGVIESVEAQDTKFNAQEAINKLQEAVDRNAILLDNRALTPDISEQILAKMAAMKDEIARINNELLVGEAAPMRETVTFKIDVTAFFPLL